MRCLLFFPSSKRVDQVLVRQPSTKFVTTFQSGFTLIELIAVITLLAIIAGIAIVSYDGVQDQGRADVTQYELTEIRKALLQFRRDTHEFPCRVYRDGAYAPDNIGILDNDSANALDFTNLPASPNSEHYHRWCLNNPLPDDKGVKAQDWALSMLLTFPYDDTDTDTDTNYMSLLWNPDTKRGWHGPYINNHGIKDAWGNNILLLDPELDYSPEYRCKNNGSNGYDVTGGLYSCLKANNPDWDLNYTEDANIVRLVSMGENGVYDGINPSDPCTPNEDDFVLCLLR